MLYLSIIGVHAVLDDQCHRDLSGRLLLISEMMA